MFTKLKKAKGFTLVEMSIVLVIIGLVLGAVSIGKDLQRDAEYSKIKQKFVDQWVQSYNAFYQRAGVVVGDNQAEPRFMVNGTNYTAATNSPVSGGDMSSVTAPGAICQGSAAPGVSATGINTALHTYFDALGVRMPPGRAEGLEDRYVYLDSNGNPQEVQICFQWNKPTTASGSGNVMVLTGLTPDLARTLDHMIDGKADAQEGVFRQQGVANGTAGGAGVEWGQDNTVGYAQQVAEAALGFLVSSAHAGPGGPAAGGAQSNLDEDQVVTVVAHYKMNQ